MLTDLSYGIVCQFLFVMCRNCLDSHFQTNSADLFVLYGFTQALGSTVRYGSPNPLNDALPLLAKRACDNTPSIRSCLVDVVGNWLLELPDR